MYRAYQIRIPSKLIGFAQTYSEQAIPSKGVIEGLKWLTRMRLVNKNTFPLIILSFSSWKRASKFQFWLFFKSKNQFFFYNPKTGVYPLPTINILRVTDKKPEFHMEQFIRYLMISKILYTILYIRPNWFCVAFYYGCSMLCSGFRRNCKIFYVKMHIKYFLDFVTWHSRNWPTYLPFHRNISSQNSTHLPTISALRIIWTSPKVGHHVANTFLSEFLTPMNVTKWLCDGELYIV